ncbi:MAG: ATP-binding protein, partial [Dokdonella sp.]
VRETDGRIVHVALTAFDDQRGDLMVIGLLAQADGSVLVGTRRGIARVGGDLTVSEIILGAASIDGNVTAMVYDDDGALWASTSHGVLRIENGVAQHFGAGEPMTGDLPGLRVTHVIKDREGGLWFTLSDGGVARLPARSRQFAAWRHRPGSADSLQHNRISAVGVDERDNVWVVSSNDGLDRIDAHTGAIARYGEALGVQGTLLRGILAHGDDLWVGGNAGLRRFSLRGEAPVELPGGAGRDRIPKGLVEHLQLAANGELWLATRGGGVARVEPKSLSIRSYSPAVGTLGETEVRSLQLDASGTPWVAGALGVERFDAANDRFSVVPGTPREPVHAIAFAADGALWLHRLAALERYTQRDGSFEVDRRFAADQGWPAMSISALHVAADGSVWAASPRGLWRVDPDSKAIRVFTERDGLPSAEFANGGFAVGSDGVVHAPTLGGVVAFDPAAIRFDSAAPPLRLTGFSVRREGAVRELDPRAPLALLRHDDSDITFSLRAFSFVNPAGNRYRFRLENFDRDWVDGNARGERVFSQLPAGRFRLHARAANADGVWADLAQPFEFKVAPSPWATPLAYLFYALVAGLVAFVALRGWRARVEQRHALDIAEESRRYAERLGAAKSTFLATMSHEIRTPMTGVLGMTELLQGTSLDKRQRGYADAIARSGDLMLRLVNDSLDLARIEAGKFSLEARAFDPAELVREVVTLEAPLAAQKNLELLTCIERGIASHVHGDAMRIKQVLLNLVNNALKFTERGHVEVRLSGTRAGHLRFEVADSGPGMTADMRDRLFGRFEQSGGVAERFGGSGLGLSIARELVELMGGRIDVDSVLGSGTRFSVELPLAASLRDDDASAASTAGAFQHAPANMPSTALPGLHVLVVEDDTTIAQVITTMLADAGYRTTHAPHGLAALAELSRPGVDVALVDLDLPGIDGLQLARLVRQREADGAARVALIAITARAHGDEEQQVRQAGMDGFLRKPLSKLQLESVIATHARRPAHES